MLSDEEILELETLLKEQEKYEMYEELKSPTEKSNKNYRFLHKAISEQRWEWNVDRPELVEGYAGCVLEGSSRSGKTISSVDIIIWLATVKHKDKGCSINIYRETYNEFKTTLYDDFKRRLTDYDLPNKFNDQQEIKQFNIGKSKVFFLGDGKHGGSSDYAFFNEAMMIRKAVFDQVEMRCRKFWWMDYNPSFTEHWVFRSVLKRKDVGFLRTTFKDNRFISAQELNKILSYEPWLPDSYEVMENEVVYQGKKVTEKHQPPPHPTNVEAGTADEFMWKVYGLGLRGAMKGVIYDTVRYIDAFPEDVAPTYGLDFGFTCFSGDTLITTDRGDVPIRDVKGGDMVLTRKGYKRVLCKKYNGKKRTVTKRFGFDFGYTEISATLEHHFNADNGWKRLGDLQGTETLCTLSPSTGRSTNDTLTGRIRSTTSGNGNETASTSKKGCTEPYTNITKGLFRKGWTCITSMATLSTTIFRISCLLPLESTLRSMVFCLSTIAPLKGRGTEVSTDTVKTTGQKDGRSSRRSSVLRSEHVSGARQNTPLRTHIRDFVRRSVITFGSTRQRLTTQRWNASVVAKNLWEINILNQRPAVTDAHIRYQQPTELIEISSKVEDVFDLHVEDVHEYFANGVLVHNCDPSALVKYAKRGRDVYIELLFYAPTETVTAMEEALIACNVDPFTPITADSADRYVGESNGVVQMVSGLFERGWEISKVSKTKGITFWILDMKGYRINIVDNHMSHHIKKEVENYRWKEINGILINQPIDGHDHALSAARYAHMSDDFNNLEEEIY